MTATKMAGCPKTKKMTTKLVCPCGKRLEVSVRKKGWLLSLEAVALANNWKIDPYADVTLSDEIAAFCPHCRIKP